MYNWKNTYVAERVVIVQPAPVVTEVVQQNDRRVALLMMNVSTATIYSTVPGNLITSGGLPLTSLTFAQGPPNPLTRELHGRMVTCAWSASIPAGQDVVSVIEVLESDR